MINKKYIKPLRIFAGFVLILIGFFTVKKEVDYYYFKKEMGYYNFYLPMSYPHLSSKELCHNCEMKIPKIIHRVWMVFDPTKPNMPEVYKKFDARLKELHPDWKIMEWNDENSLEFVKQHYPDFLPTYYSYTIPVQRLDAIRYLVVHHYGGLAIQHSFYVEKNLEPLLKGHDFVCSELLYNQDKNNRFNTLFINNNFFASVPKHPIISKTIEYLPIRLKIKMKDMGQFWYVFNTTGPFLFSDTIFTYLDKNQDPGVKILDSMYLAPFTNMQKDNEPLWSNCILKPEKCHHIYPDFYGLTLSTGAWIK